MPLYEYHCNKCKRNFEFFQKITENPKSKCPECDGKLTKLISESAFHLKGTGWYKTDYADKSKKKEEKVGEKKEDKKEPVTQKKESEKTSQKESKKSNGN